MKIQTTSPFNAVFDTVNTVRLAVSAATEYRRQSNLRHSGKAGNSILPLD